MSNVDVGNENCATKNNHLVDSGEDNDELDKTDNSLIFLISPSNSLGVPIKL